MPQDEGPKNTIPKHVIKNEVKLFIAVHYAEGENGAPPRLYRSSGYIN